MDLPNIKGQNGNLPKGKIGAKVFLGLMFVDMQVKCLITQRSNGMKRKSQIARLAHKPCLLT